MKILQVPEDWCYSGDQNRVVALNNQKWLECAGGVLSTGDGAYGRHDAAFKRMGVARDGVWRRTLPFQQSPTGSPGRVRGCAFRAQSHRHPCALEKSFRVSVSGIDRLTLPRSQSAHEPIAVKCRNISSITGRYDHYDAGFLLQTA